MYPYEREEILLVVPLFIIQLAMNFSTLLGNDFPIECFDYNILQLHSDTFSISNSIVSSFEVYRARDCLII